MNLSAFPIVHPELVKYDEIRRFLEKEGIREIDAIAIVEKSILPKYKDPNMRFDESVYHNDLRRIRNAYRNANDAEKSELKSILSGYSWLACLHASGKDTDCIVWKRPGTSDLFEKTDENKAWFGGLEDVGAFFLHPSVVETLDELTSCITCTSGTIIKNLSTEEYTITLSNEYWNHKRGLKGFDPRATIVGIESAFDNWNQARSIVLWNTLVSAPSKIISGETQFATNRQKLDRAPKKIEYTVVGKYCTEKAWLMNKSGTWCKPNPLLLTDLPEEYETESIAAKELAVKLGMRQAEREQALEVVTRGDHDLKRLIEHYHSVSEDERKKILKTIPHLIPPEPAPSFRDGLKNIGRPQRARIEGGSNEGTPPSNPERYQENLDSQVETGKLDHLSTPQRTTFSPVRDLPSNEEARRFLYEEYCGLCQVTETTFPKASPNRHGVAENYFEAYSLLSYTNTNYLNDAGNMLCVSADTMAKFNHASVEMKDFEKKIESFIQSNEKPDKVIVQIRLAGEECTITWSQRHFMRLVALYTKA